MSWRRSHAAKDPGRLAWSAVNLSHRRVNQFLFRQCVGQYSDHNPDANWMCRGSRPKPRRKEPIMPNTVLTTTHGSLRVEDSRALSAGTAARIGPRATGPDARRARMQREVEDYGFEWRVAFEAGRLLAAMAIGATLAFSLAGHRPTAADVSAPRPGVNAGAAAMPRAPASSPEEQGRPAMLTPSSSSMAEAPDTPQRDVHSDGGGH